MALARGTAVTNSAAAGTTVTLASVNLGSSDTCLLLVGGRSGSQGTASSVTFNGSATGWARIGSAYTAEGITLDVWRCIGFTPATANIVITFGATIDTVVWGTALPYSGVDTAGTPFSATADQSSATDPITQTLASAAGEEVIAFANFRTTGITPTPLASDAGQTDIYEDQELTFGSTWAVTAEAGAASVSCGWSGQGSVSHAMRMIAVKPSAGGGGSVSRLMLLGVG